MLKGKRRDRIAYSCCAAVIGVILVAGCGRSDIGQVYGTVKFEGKPLKEAIIEFHPPDGGRPATGATDENGYYEMMYMMNQPGAKVGKNKVKIYYDLMEDDEGNILPPPVDIPDKYNADTELVKEVTSGSNEINFNLEAGNGNGAGSDDAPNRPPVSWDGCE